MQHYELVHECIMNGFDIEAYITPEDMHPDDCFDYKSMSDNPQEYRKQLLTDIDNYDQLWFIGRVTASKNGIELGNCIVGGYLYKNAQAWLDDCLNDMALEAIHEAENNIKKLIAA